MKPTTFLLPLILCAGTLPLQAAEVFEAALGRETELPQGKEADGIRGDFVLRSDKVEAVISQNAPNRRANMSTFYGEDGVTPGCLYDLTLRGAANDQLVVYGPCGHGHVSYVRMLESKEADSAAVESVTTAGKNGGVFKRHEYRVKDGVQGVFITTTLRNETDKPQKVNTKADLTRFDSTGMTADGIFWADAINPAHKCGYAISGLKITGAQNVGDTLELAPKQEVIIERFFAVGTSPAAAVGEFRSVKSGMEMGVFEAQIVHETPRGAADVKVMVPDGKEGKVPVPAYTDGEGRLSLKLPAGNGQLDVIGRDGRHFTQPADVVAGETKTVVLHIPRPSGIRFDITDDSGKSIPCKAHFKPLDEGAPKLDLGPKWRAHGCVDQYHSEKGQFTVHLPPGKYRTVVVRGPEFSHLEQEVIVEPGLEAMLKGTLKRLVDTKGWISADFHNHSTPSGDNVCDTDGRIINIAVEHLEFAPTTEHNRLYDWEPTIKALGLESFIKTVKGMELTGSRQHFNAFPFEPVPFTQDGGAPVWNDDPRITALTLRRWQGERADRWIQFNHPDLANMFTDRNSDGIADGGFVGVGGMIDGSESQNGPGTDILAEAPFKLTRPQGSLAMKVSTSREFAWRQLLNQGLRVTAVGVADAHSVYGNGVGCWRCYLPSSTDEPGKIDWAELAPHAKAGHIVLSTGPFLEVTTQNGKIAGDDDRATGSIDLKVRVQCTDWLDINRVQVLVNSRPDPTLNFTRESHPQMFQDGVVKFDQKIHIPLQHDAHLIVVATHETMTQEIGFGTSDYGRMRPCAYNNPIYVDADGHGFTPNGDTLGFDLPIGGLNADKVKAKLIKAGVMKAEEPKPAANGDAPKKPKA
ncbi:MAG: CehA/McbA family metallohydrolase [Prosthecobacter sp.]